MIIFEVTLTIIDLKLHYYPFMVNLDRFGRSCNTLDDLSDRLCFPNKAEDKNLKVLNMAMGSK